MLLARVQKRLREQGPWSVLVRAFVVGRDAILPPAHLIYWLPLAGYPDSEVDTRVTLRVVTRENLKALNAEELAAVEANVGESSLPVIRERLDHGCELHILLYEGRVVGTRFFILGREHSFQHVVLTDRDAMDIDGRIRPEFRGRGLNPVFFYLNIRHLRKQGLERLYVACREDNQASVRSFARVGFRFLGKYRNWRGYHIYEPREL